jgi:hypothetical protein
MATSPAKLCVSGSVNTGTVGTYTLSYNVKDAAGNAATTLTRTVTVTPKADTVKPVITLNGSASMSIVQGSTFADPGATATDDRDGNITSKIVVTGSVNTGTGWNLYPVLQRQGRGDRQFSQHPDTHNVTVTPKPDTVKPVITLNGSASMSVVQGSTFTDPGATASDDRDGNITSKIVRDWQRQYQHGWHLHPELQRQDAAGNAATTLARTVTVTPRRIRSNP